MFRRLLSEMCKESGKERGPHWAIELLGDKKALQNAANLFSEGAFALHEETLPGGRHATLMTSDQFESLTDRRAVHDSANDLVRKLNAILFIGGLRGAEPLRLAGGPMERAPNGNWNYSLVAEPGRYTIRMGGSPTPELTSVDLSRWLQIAANDEVVLEVLDFVRADADWFSLYKAFERMRHDINGQLRQHRASEMGWPSKADLDHFTQSANVHRHSSAKWPKGYSLDKAMTLEEGQNFVRKLIRAWLDWRSQQT